MRISGNAKDRDYWRNHFSVCPDVFFDGALMHHVVEADTDRGFVVVEVWIDGKPTLESTGASIARRLLSGAVSIINRTPISLTGGGA